jgi:hypothetical protein
MHAPRVTSFDTEVVGQLDAAVNGARADVAGEALAFISTEPTADRARPLKHAAYLVNNRRAPDMRG